MVVKYDSYNYPQYWQGRKYEDLAEKIALRKLFKLIPNKKCLIDIGGGFGRLAKVYLKEFNECLLVDPSEKLLKQARSELGNSKNLQFKQGSAQNLPAKNNQFDVALIVRVSHHLSQLKPVIQEIKRILKPNSHLILEFANKINLKSTLRAILKKNLYFLISHLPANISSKKTVPFINYHPNQIRTILLSNGFKIIKTLSVSNFRSPLFKKIVPLKVLLILESIIQSFLAHFYTGPSIFILARKSE